MVNATGAAREYASRLGIKEGQLVQEVDWDTGCDSATSESVENFLGADLLDEDTDGVIDVVLLWWREENGDLVDGLVDVSRPLEDESRVWLLTPGASQPGAVDPGVINESAQLADFSNASALRLEDRQSDCLVQRSSQPTLVAPFESTAS